MDLHLSEPGPEEEVANRDQDDEREGVEVREDVVGEPIELHDGGLRDQVVVQLVVGEPVEGEPKEDRTSVEAAANFVDPGIVEGHPLWASCRIEFGGLNVLPECAVVQVLVGRDGVEVPAAFIAKKEEVACFAENGSGGWCTDVPVATQRTTRGQRHSRTVGRRKASQKPTHFSAYTIPIWPTRAPMLMNR